MKSARISIRINTRYSGFAQRSENFGTLFILLARERATDAAHQGRCSLDLLDIDLLTNEIVKEPSAALSMILDFDSLHGIAGPFLGPYRNGEETPPYSTHRTRQTCLETSSSRHCQIEPVAASDSRSPKTPPVAEYNGHRIQQLRLLDFQDFGKTERQRGRSFEVAVRASLCGPFCVSNGLQKDACEAVMRGRRSSLGIIVSHGALQDSMPCWRI